MSSTDNGARWAARPLEPPRLEAFQVPPRFSNASFESYRPDPRYPSQGVARARLAAWVETLEQGRERGLFGRFRRRRAEERRSLYLDGGFGVGKTHLLAAAWHAATDVSKAYLSFQELTYVVGALGMASTLDLLGEADLICLDEFELDDPGNTMLATSFVRGALGRESRIIATSNTLPNELGRGRFNAEEFSREIGQLAAAFDTVPIDGEDYRHRRFGGDGPPPGLLPAGTGSPPVGFDVYEWETLLADLSRVHPIHYGSIAAGLPGLWIDGAASIGDQDTALRFVHFADKLYDYRVPLVVCGTVTLENLFPSSYGYGSFERKFRRCRSRLYEMLSERAEDLGRVGPAVAAGD